MTMSRSLWVVANEAVAAHQAGTQLLNGSNWASPVRTIRDVAWICKPAMDKRR